MKESKVRAGVARQSPSRGHDRLDQESALVARGGALNNLSPALGARAERGVWEVPRGWAAAEAAATKSRATRALWWPPPRPRKPRPRSFPRAERGAKFVKRAFARIVRRGAVRDILRTRV